MIVTKSFIVKKISTKTKYRLKSYTMSWMIPIVLIMISLSSGMAQDTWTSITDFGGDGRYRAFGFSIDGKGYVGTGEGSATLYKDLWEYDPELNTWSQKADFGGGIRSGAVAFVIGGKGYAGTGFGAAKAKPDFWEYDPLLNTWTQKADYGGGKRFAATGFSIGDKGYIGTGADENDNTKKDFWEYNPELDKWKQKKDFGGDERFFAFGFSINNKGYIGTGSNFSTTNDFWEYDPASNTWMKKADYGGGKRNQAFGLTIGSKGYAGMGADGSTKKDFWEYDPVSDIWIQKTNYAGLGSSNVTGFSIGTKGYIGTGGGLSYKDFWEYNLAIVQECFAPTNLLTKNITSTSAKFKWEQYAGATGYKLRYKLATTGSWTLLGPNGQTKTVEGLEANMQYVWQIKSVCGIDPKTTSDWSEKQYFTTAARLSSANNDVPFSMYPNPVKGIVNIEFTLPSSSHVNIQVCDASGREITCDNLPDEMFEVGSHSISIDLGHFSQGIYFLRMISELGVSNQKLIVQ